MNGANLRKYNFDENECGLTRWILTALTGYIGGSTAASFAYAALELTGIFNADGPLGFMSSFGLLMTSYAVTFAVTAAAIKSIAGTSLRAFTIGSGSTKFSREMLADQLLFPGFAFFIGASVICLFESRNISMRGLSAAQFVILLVFSLMFVWMQTTAEEFIFKGIFIRYACGNDIRFSCRSAAAGLVSALIFTSLHFFNPEMLARSGAMDVLLAASYYFISAMLGFMLDLHYGSLLPGIAIHFVNNFHAFVLVGGEASAGSSPSLLVDRTVTSGAGMLLKAVILYLPVLVLAAYRSVKGKKKAGTIS